MRPSAPSGPAQRWLPWVPVALLVLVAGAHLLWLHPVLGVSKWKGGGLGVYCTVPERRVATWVDLGDDAGWRLARTTPWPRARLFAGWFAYVPLAGEGWLDAHVTRTFETGFAVSTAHDGQGRVLAELGGRRPRGVRVQTWVYAFDGPTGGQWRLTDVRTEVAGD